MRAYLVIAHVALFALVCLLSQFLMTAKNPSLYGAILHLSSGLGAALIPLAAGLVGLLAPPGKRLAAYLIVSWGALIGMLNLHWLAR